MRLIDQLRAVPVKPAPPKTGRFSPESQAKRRATLRRNRIARWREVFARFEGMTATTNGIVAATLFTPRAVNLICHALVADGVVTQAGTVPTRGNGKDMIVWKWII